MRRISGHSLIFIPMKSDKRKLTRGRQGRRHVVPCQMLCVCVCLFVFVCVSAHVCDGYLHTVLNVIMHDSVVTGI